MKCVEKRLLFLQNNTARACFALGIIDNVLNLPIQVHDIFVKTVAVGIQVIIRIFRQETKVF